MYKEITKVLNKGDKGRENVKQVLDKGDTEMWREITKVSDKGEKDGGKGCKGV